MKSRICKSIICALLIMSSLIGSVHCFAKNYTVGEVNTLINGIVSYRASSLGVNSEQGIIDYYASNSMTLGGEWYVLSFVQNGSVCNFSAYEKSLINYLENNSVYSATSREKFALVLVALDSDDSFARQYIKDTTNEAIGKQGIMSLIFGLHLLNNGCKSNEYTALSLAEKIVSLQNSDGGWANSGTVSDVDVTAMTLEALYPFRNSLSESINKAINLLSSRQSENGDFQSYGVYNTESTAQVIIALSSLGIDCVADERFIKNGNSVLDGLVGFRVSNGSFEHKKGDGSNGSATFQALNALTAYARFLKGQRAFYKFDNSFEDNTQTTVHTTSLSEKQTEKTTKQNTENTTSKNKTDKKHNDGTTLTNDAGTVVSSPEKVSGGTTGIYSNDYNTTQNGNQTPALTDEQGSVVSNKNEQQTTAEAEENGTVADESQITEENESITQQTTALSVENEIQKAIELSEGSITLSKEFKIKLTLIGAVLLIALIACAVLLILKKKNYKNFLVIGLALIIAVTSILFIRINTVEDYYNSTDSKSNITGSVYITVRCDTIIGKENAPENPVILEKTECEITDGDTVYNVLAEALRENGILFEHNSSYYISGIDNLYEFQFGDLSGWMYRVNGETPSVGCGEYVLSDGDVIEWLYTCEIGNDFDIYEKT